MRPATEGSEPVWLVLQITIFERALLANAFELGDDRDGS